MTFIPVGGIEASAVNLTILHTNDEESSGVIPHSPAIDYTPAVGDDPSVGGYARLATEIYRIRDAKALENELVLTLNAGDFLMKSMFTWLGGMGLTPELTLMQKMGYDAVTLGNHEFDWSSEYLASYLSAAGYPDAAALTPIVASNIIIPPGHPLEDVGIVRYIVKELPNALNVGIFGIMGYDAIFVSPLAAPVNFSDPWETAAEMVDVLTALEVDLIVCLSHSGVSEDMDMASAAPGIDVIIGGHSEDALFEAVIVGETIIVQAGNRAEYLGQLELSISQDGVSIRNYELIPINDSIPADPSLKADIDSKYIPRLNLMVSSLTHGMFDEILDVVAESGFDLLQPPLTETGLGNLVADSMRAAGSADFAFEANGLIEADVLRGSMPGKEGLISLYGLHAAVSLGIGPDEFPGYPIASFRLTAEEIRRVCEISVAVSTLMGDSFFMQVSGLRFEYNASLVDTFGAVTKIEKYVGSGPQNDSVFYETLYENGEWAVDPGETLYKVVGNLYVTFFLPYIAEEFPSLEVVPKDQGGNPIDPLDAIVYQAGTELKVWKAVLDYVSNFPDTDADEIPDVPPWYDGPMGRILGVRLQGDLNGDGIVDIFDVVTVATAFGTKPGDEKWNPVADLNNDSMVDIFDVVTVTSNFGKGA